MSSDMSMEDAATVCLLRICQSGLVTLKTEDEAVAIKVHIVKAIKAQCKLVEKDVHLDWLNLFTRNRAGDLHTDEARANEMIERANAAFEKRESHKS